MKKETVDSNPNPNKEDYRKNFVRQAGISQEILKNLELEQPRRETRYKREPILLQQNFKIQLPSHETNPDLHRSPVASISRQQTPSTPTTPKRELRSVTQTTPKVLRTPENKFHKKEIVSVPKSVDEFYQNYITFFTRLSNNSENQLHFIETYKQQLFELFKAVISIGGIVKIISQGNKNLIFEPFVERLNVQTSDEIFKIYKLYLFHFEYHILENYSFKEYHNAVQLFDEAVFVQEQELRNFLDKTPLDPKYFEYDIMVFKNGQNAIGIDSATIHLDRVAEHYKNYNIDIRIQKAMDYGFKPRTMRNEPYQMKIGNYRVYQKLCEQYAMSQTKIDKEFIERLGSVKDLDVNGYTFKERVNDEEIFFGVNFDPDGNFLLTLDGLLFDYINERVDGTFLGYKQEFDLLSYLDQEVPGCSFPQFYFKVKGVWTGGHQENINMCAVNINHGPDASEWYSMEFKYVEEFRAQLKKEHKMDLYGSEGLWYEKINWFMEQGKYPVKKIIQKKGDIVVSGPGTLHWVRSHGIALQSAWNQFPITYRMMEFAFWRQQENERINFIRSNTIPLKMLTVKLLNHQPPQLTSQIKALCLEKLRMWYQKQQELFNELLNEEQEFAYEQPRYQKLEDLQGFCTKCRQEILIYFISGKNVEDILCLGCFKKEYKNKKKTKRVYIRNTIFDLEQLIRRTALGKPFKEIRAFCGQYVGRVPVKCNQNKYKIDKQSLFIEKINAMNQELNKCDKKKMKEFLQKMKSKRASMQQEEKEEQKPQEPQKLEKQQKMEIEQNITEPIKIVEEKPIQKIQAFKIVDGIKFIDYHSSPSGWWSFEVPEHLRIVTEKNHSALLKLIQKQQYHTMKIAQQYGRNPQFPLHVVREKSRFEYREFENHYRNYESHRTRKYENIQRYEDPQFSEDEETKKDTIKKKVHKNEDYDEKNHRQQQKKSLPEQIFPKPQTKKMKNRSKSNESKKSKRSYKHKKQHSRSKSTDKQRKRHKKSRSKSPKSSKKQHKKQDKHRSPSSSRRSKSRGKSSRKESNRIDEQRSSRNRERKGEQRNDRRNDDRGREHSNYQRDYNRESNRNYNQQRNDRDYRDNNKDDGMRRNYDNRDSGRNNRDYDDRRNSDRNNNYTQRRNNYNQRSQNQGYQRRDNKQSGYQGNRYQGRDDSWNNNNDRRYNDGNNRPRHNHDERTESNRREDNSQNNNHSGFNIKIPQQNEQNDVDY